MMSQIPMMYIFGVRMHQIFFLVIFHPSLPKKFVRALLQLLGTVILVSFYILNEGVLLKDEEVLFNQMCHI